MELNDALRRIFVRHARLIICCMLLPLLVVAAMAAASGREYSATARIQASAVDPATDTEADAVLNRTLGVATSPNIVQAALLHAGVTADATRFAAKQVSASRLGSSAVVTITVTDRSPTTAANVSRTLAEETVHFINEKLGPEPPSGTSAVGGGYVIYAPDTAQPVSLSHTTADLALALIAGLLVGLLAAAAIEVVRPTVPGASAFGRELGIPVLGAVGTIRRRRRLGRSGRRQQSITARFQLLTGLRRAAERADVRLVALIGPVPTAWLEVFAVELDGRLPADDDAVVHTPSSNGSSAGRPPVVTTLAAIASGAWPPERVGLVVVAPRFAPQDALTQVRNLAESTGWPLLGVLSSTSPTAIPDEETRWTSTSCPPPPTTSDRTQTTTHG